MNQKWNNSHGIYKCMATYEEAACPTKLEIFCRNMVWTTEAITIFSQSVSSHLTLPVTFNKPLFLFGPQVPLCQMRGLKVSNLILYSSHCILDYSNMSLPVLVPIGQNWDNGRWQGIDSYQWNALQLWASQTWTGSGSDGRQTESVGCGSPTTTKLVSLTVLQFWICNRRHTL